MTTTIAEIIDAVMPSSQIQHHLGVMTEYDSILTGRATMPDQFSSQVFDFLNTHRQGLGVLRVFEATNLLVDGGIELTDGRFLAVEVKYRMNWLKACQAGWQFGQFLRRPEAADFNAVGGIVFFEEFSGDWSRRLGGVERGWLSWYPGHATLPGRQAFRLDLIRLRGGKMETRTDST